MIYRANFNAQGTTLALPLVDTNKQRLCDDIKKIAMGYATDRNVVYFDLYSEDMTFAISGKIECKKVKYLFKKF
jgi:hypothetical protein